MCIYNQLHIHNNGGGAEIRTKMDSIFQLICPLKARILLITLENQTNETHITKKTNNLHSSQNCYQDS